MPFTIYHDVPIVASANKVFLCLSNPRELEKWWPLQCAGDPAVGNTYRFFFSEEYDWYGEVVDCVPDKKLHIKMTKSDADWQLTTFGFDLTEQNSATLLSFFHSDWAETNPHFRRTSYCWALLLSGLKNYVEKGIVIPFEERS